MNKSRAKGRSVRPKCLTDSILRPDTASTTGAGSRDQCDDGGGQIDYTGRRRGNAPCYSVSLGLVEFEVGCCQADGGTGVNREGIGVTTRELNVTLPLTVSEDEARLLFAVKLYEVGRVSLGQAARLAGFSKRAFMDMLGRYRVPVFNHPEEDLQQEIGA